MILLCFGLKWEGIVEHINGKFMRLHCSMLEENAFENTTVKSHVCTT